MSHFSRIRTQMGEKGPIPQSLRDLNYPFEEGENLTVKDFFGRSEHVDFKIHMPGNKAVGLRLHNGVYEVVGDWYNIKGITQKEFTEKLNQRYAYHATRAKLEKQGFNLVEEKVEESGQIRLVLRRATD